MDFGVLASVVALLSVEVLVSVLNKNTVLNLLFWQNGIGWTKLSLYKILIIVSELAFKLVSPCSRE